MWSRTNHRLSLGYISRAGTSFRTSGLHISISLFPSRPWLSPGSLICRRSCVGRRIDWTTSCNHTSSPLGNRTHESAGQSHAFVLSVHSKHGPAGCEERVCRDRNWNTVQLHHWERGWESTMPCKVILSRRLLPHLLCSANDLFKIEHIASIPIPTPPFFIALDAADAMLTLLVFGLSDHASGESASRV